MPSYDVEWGTVYRYLTVCRLFDVDNAENDELPVVGLRNRTGRRGHHVWQRDWIADATTTRDGVDAADRAVLDRRAVGVIRQEAHHRTAVDLERHGVID